MPSQYGFKFLIYIGPDSWHRQSKPRPGSQVSHWPLHRLVERERCQLKTPRHHGAAKHFENDCQFGLVSAERMPKREGMPVIKQFRGGRKCFGASEAFQLFSMAILFAYMHALLKVSTCVHTCVHFSQSKNSLWSTTSLMPSSLFSMQATNTSNFRRQLQVN